MSTLVFTSWTYDSGSVIFGVFFLKQDKEGALNFGALISGALIFGACISGALIFGACISGILIFGACISGALIFGVLILQHDKEGFLQEGFLHFGHLQHLGSLQHFGNLQHEHLAESFLQQAKLPSPPKPIAPIMIKLLYPPSFGIMSRIVDTV